MDDETLSDIESVLYMKQEQEIMKMIPYVIRKITDNEDLAKKNCFDLNLKEEVKESDESEEE